ncbi:hypothetical protein E1165_00125 [Micromonospora sp. KC723]|nr:hypothetical protein E1165_00125 [Micromonospora sp. KC723]
MKRDLRVNGLYPDGSPSQDERPAHLWETKVENVEVRVEELLHKAATAAVAALRSHPASS